MIYTVLVCLNVKKPKKLENMTHDLYCVGVPKCKKNPKNLKI